MRSFDAKMKNEMPVFVTVRPTGDWGVLPTSESIEASGLVTSIQIPNCYREATGLL